MLYTTEMFSFSLLSSGSDKQRPSSLCAGEEAGAQRGEGIY